MSVLAFSSLLAVPEAQATTLPNIIEGNWTGYTSIYTITSGNAWGSNPLVVVDTSGNVLIENGNLGCWGITSAGTVTKLATTCNSAATAGPVSSAFGSYEVFVGSGATNVIKNGALLTSLTQSASLGSASSATISPDGQWILEFDNTNPAKIQLWQATGVAAIISPATTLCSEGVPCNPVSNGQPGYTGPSSTATTQNFVINPVNLNGGNITQAAQTIQQNPLPYGLIILIIIVTISVAILLGYSQKGKTGFRKPANQPASFRRR